MSYQWQLLYRTPREARPWAGLRRSPSAPPPPSTGVASAWRGPRRVAALAVLVAPHMSATACLPKSKNCVSHTVRRTCTLILL